VPKRRGLSVPVFGIIPNSLGNADLHRWLHSFQNGIQQFTRDVVEIGADYDLIAHVTRQTVAAGFSITPDSHDIELSSAADVTSSTTFAVRDGRNGQTIVLTNVGTHLITLKDNANTKLGEDITLNTNDTVVLKWSDTLDDWSIIGSGNLISSVSRGNIAAGTGNIGVGEDVLWTWTMPANTMVAGSMLSVSAVVNCAANANTKTLKFHLGGSSITLNPTTTAPNNLNFGIELKIWYNTNTSATGMETVHKQPTVLEGFTGFFMNTTIDFSTTNVVKFTGEATNDGDISVSYASAIATRML